MRIVRLADLSEEERKRVLEEQQNRVNQNRQASQGLQRQANEKFNSIVNNSNTYDTNRHTTTFQNIINTMKQTGLSNNSINTFKNSNRISLWDTVKETANNLGKTTENTWNKMQERVYGNNLPPRTNYQQQFVSDRNKVNSLSNLFSQAEKREKDARLIDGVQTSKKVYQQLEKEKIKNTLIYKQVKQDNPNASEDEILKISKEKNGMFENNFTKWLASTDGVRRTTTLKGLSNGNNDKYRNLNSQVLQYKTAMEAQQEADKINQDIANGNYWSSIGHVAEGLGSKAIGATAAPLLAMRSLLNTKTPNGTADQDLRDWKIIDSKHDQIVSNVDNGIIKTASSVSGTIGGMVPSILASVMAPETNIGRLIQAGSIAGQSYNETLNDDASNKFKALVTGIGKATASYKIEGLTGGNFLGKGSLDDLAIKTIASKTSSKAGQKIASLVYEVGGEQLEEIVENQVGYLIDTVVNNKGITLNEWLGEQEETLKNTALTTLTLNLLGLGGNTYKDIKEFENNKEMNAWLNEAQKIIDKENLIINTEKLKIENNRNEVDNVLKTLQQKNQQISLQENIAQNKQIFPEQQITQEQNKMIETNYDVTAKRYHIDTNNATVKGMYELANRRGLDIFFDDTVFASSRQNAKWMVDENGNRTVVINPNADTGSALQSVMIHELTHDLEGSSGYDKLNKMILNKLKQTENYDEMMLDIANAYKGEYSSMSKENFSKMIEQEAVADYLGENLGNQEFVNELIRSQDRNTIQKIMDWVKNKITLLKNAVTGNEEANYWNKIRENFEKAYNEEYQANQITEKFSIQVDSDGNQYVRVDTDQDIFGGIKKKDYNKIAKMYMQDYLKGNTRLARNDNTDIGRRGINKYTNPQQDTRFFEEKMKLTPELKNVLEIAKKVSIGTPTKETTKFPNWEYYKVNFELGGENFEGLINIGIDKEGNKHFYEINKIHNTRNIECFIETKKYSG